MRVLRPGAMSSRALMLVACGGLAALGCGPDSPPGTVSSPVDARAGDSAVDAESAAAVVRLAPIGADASDLALGERYAYWRQDASIYRVRKDSGPDANPEVLITPAVTPNGLAVAGGYVYWSSSDQRAISRVSVAGGAEELQVSWVAEGGPARAVLIEDTHVYWREEFAVARADLNGGERELLISVADRIGAMTLGDDSVYFTTPDAGYEVWRIDRDGGPATVAFGIIVLSGDSVLGNAAGRILQCGKDSVDPYRSLIAGYSAPDGPGEVMAIIPDTAMAVTGDSKYAYCAADTGIHRVPRTSGAVEMLVGGQHIVSAVVDPDGLFWLDQGAMALYRRRE